MSSTRAERPDSLGLLVIHLKQLPREVNLHGGRLFAKDAALARRVASGLHNLGGALRCHGALQPLR